LWKHQVQAPESPMWVNDGLGDDGDAEEEMEKKGKEKNRWEIIGGSGRCKACWKEETACKINLGEIEKWQKSTEKGKVYKKALPAACHLLSEVHGGEAEALHSSGHGRMSTEDGKTREANEAIGSTFCQFGQEEAFGGHRSRASAQEKQKKVEEKMLTEEEFWMEVADTLGLIAVDAACFARAAELQNFLLQRLVVVLEGKGDGTAYSMLPSGGKLLTEDKAEESYKPVSG